MHKELPELDAVIGIGANGDIARLLTQMMEEDQYVESFPDKSKMPLCGQRELTTPSYFAYVKIAEGCDNRCSYCAIPLIRGGYRSRTMESIEEECRAWWQTAPKSSSSSPRTPPATASTCTGSTLWPS